VLLAQALPGGVRRNKRSERNRGGRSNRRPDRRATSILARFKAAARKYLCEKGGVLHTQWTKWKDLANKDIVKTFGGILVGMGLSGSALQIAVVAIAVYVLYLGVEAFCREV
jgi:hypothetical protein